MVVRVRTSFAAMALIGALSACGGGGGGGGDSRPSGTPIAGTTTATLQKQLGVTPGTNKTMRAATSFGGAANGTVRVDTDPGRITASVGGYTTPAVSENTPVTAVMDGQVSRAEDGGTVFYVPRTNSDMHVGMVHRSTGELGFAGVFGSETPSAAIGARAANGGKATYTGQAEYTQDHGVQASGYRGSITANADFDTAGLSYQSGTMTRFTNTGGAGSMRMNGSGVFNSEGQVTGTYTTSPSTGTGSSGTTSGAFYGPTGQNIGLVFSGTNGAGAAILDEN